MENTNNQKEQIVIDFDLIQELGGEGHLERDLTEEELGKIFYEVSDNLWEFIAEMTDKVIDYSEMLAANKNARNVFPHYQVTWKNENAYQKDFKERGCFLNLDDAKRFVRYDFIGEFDQWRIYKVEQDQSLIEVYKVN